MTDKDTPAPYGTETGTARGQNRQDRGASLVNYGLVVGLIAVVAITSITSIGGSIQGLFGAVDTEIDGVIGTGSAAGGEGTAAAPSPTPSGPLYAFTTQTFTNCGHSGPTGPNQTNCRNDAQYTEAWTDDDTYYTVTAGIQLWTVPETGTYRIEAAGAEGGFFSGNGGFYGGKGYRWSGEFDLTQGDQIQIVVGHRGQDGSHCGGGGGSFVVSGSTPLIVAGGGGGCGNQDDGFDAVSGTSGTLAFDGGFPPRGGGFGINGGGGGGGASGSGGGGGGFYGDGGDGATGTTGSGGAGGDGTDGQDGGGSVYSGSGGTAFVNGATGGIGNNFDGGFGGGGGTVSWQVVGGGGGGYSGGAGAGYSAGLSGGGGGGGSFNSGTNISHLPLNDDHGFVIITLLSSP
ncbi:MAG: hypothetical protein Alpg2KO_06440 [Alphaproteobacteria bacterium]